MIAPVVALIGTEVVMLVELLAVAVAAVPLKLTVLFAGVESKFVPVMVTEVPTLPLVGLKLVMVGGGITVKLVELVAVSPPTVTVIEPVDAPAGTEVVMLVVVLAVVVAVVLLNFTVLLAKAGSKLVPVIVMDVPTAPLVGLKEVIVGVLNVETEAGFPAAVLIL